MVRIWCSGSPLLLPVDANSQYAVLDEAMEMQTKMPFQSPVQCIEYVAEPQLETGSLPMSSHSTTVPDARRSSGD